MRLEVKDLRVQYGKIEAIKGISFVVEQGEIVTLIGANGAGKTTTLKTISGLRAVSSGSITYDGQDISKMLLVLILLEMLHLKLILITVFTT
jgi:branched-chain amino acid transport system ATP-binding protein